MLDMGGMGSFTDQRNFDKDQTVETKKSTYQQGQTMKQYQLVKENLMYRQPIKCWIR